MNDNRKQFILELTKLTKQYGVKISGCGCCGSPSIDVLERDIHSQAGYAISELGDELTWITPNDEYTWNSRKDELVSE